MAEPAVAPASVRRQGSTQALAAVAAGAGEEKEEAGGCSVERAEGSAASAASLVIVPVRVPGVKRVSQVSHAWHGSDVGHESQQCGTPAGPGLKAGGAD